MSGFLQWIISPNNINSNIFTMLTVILSAMISWGISAFYFHIGNRNNVKMSVINPIKQLMETNRFTYEIHKEIEKYSKDYSVRYLKKKNEKFSMNYVFLIKNCAVTNMNLFARKV